MLSRSYGPQEPQTTRVLVRLDELSQPGEGLAGYKHRSPTRRSAQGSVIDRGVTTCTERGASCEAYKAGRSLFMHRAGPFWRPRLWQGSAQA